MPWVTGTTIRKPCIIYMTTTSIRRLRANEEVEELARMLGGVEISEKVLENARDMKNQAMALKSKNCQ